jgi:hypothetical protein
MGIQLGKNFKVDSAGNLYAYSGTFEGTVTAGNILYGQSADGTKNYGTLNGSALTGGTVNGTALINNTIAGGKLKYNTVSTSYTSSGINTSLGWADFANGVFNGWNIAAQVNSEYVACTKVSCTGEMRTPKLYLDSRSVYVDSVSVATPDGGSLTLNYLKWVY